MNLREFDCVTFMESVLALSKTLKEDAPDFAAFMQTLQQIRYRNGKVEDYASRIHYTSDWVYENERQGLLRNISSDLGGILEKKKIDFISTHREAYRQLKKDDALWHRIVTMEKNLNDRGGFHYLPKADIASQAAQIPHMAIIAFVTRIEGLDTSHVGFVFHKEDRLTFIHASSARKQVVVDEKTLHDYCAGQKGCVGIIVGEVL